jgi:hypothetical protein
LTWRATATFDRGSNPALAVRAMRDCHYGSMTLISGSSQGLLRDIVQEQPGLLQGQRQVTGQPIHELPQWSIFYTCGTNISVYSILSGLFEKLLCLEHQILVETAVPAIWVPVK